MNKRWLVPLLTFVIAGLVTHMITQRVLLRRATPPVDVWQNVSALERELNLTAEQTSQVKTLRAELGVRLMDCCAGHCAARARLPEALAAGTNGDAAATAAVDEMVRAYQDSELATLAHLRRLRAMLTPTQCRRFDAMVTECLCGACNMPGSQAGSPVMRSSP